MNLHTAALWWSQATYNRLVAIVLLMLIMVPLVATPAGHGEAALAYEGLALLLLILLLGRSPWKLSPLRVRRFFTRGSHLPVALYGICAALSTLMAGRNGYGEQSLLCLGAGLLLYYTVASQFRRATQLAKLVDTLVFLTLGLSLLGFEQYQSGHSTQAMGLYGDHQLFGSCLMILLPLVGVHALTRKRPHRQTAAQIASVLGIAALLLSQARSAWIGAVAGLVFLAVTSVIRYRQGHARLRRDHEILLPLIVLAVAVGFFLLMWPTTAGLVSRATSLRRVTVVDTWQQRQATWAGVRHMIAARPWFGHGLGQYVIQQRAYTHQGLPLSAATPGASLGELAHNFYLQTTAELGLVGLLLFAGILITFWWTGLRRVLRMSGTIRRRLLLGSLASTVAFAVDAIASPSWQLPQVAMFLWLAMGIGVACQQPPNRLAEGQEKEEDNEEEATVPIRVSRPTAVLATAGLALLLPTVVFAYDSGYGTPLSATLSPKSATIAANGTQSYTLTVAFSTGSSYNMTLSPGTTFRYVLQGGGPPPGTATGVNGQTYQSAVGENDVVVVTGTFNQNTGNNQGVVSDTGLLTVHP
jgi:putative inorganic carbon (hco3(-)) transporter